jgi:hypothetical protein
MLSAFLAVVSVTASAGEIAGLPSQSPPSLDPDFSIAFSNDFLGRGGSTDDFRTTQIILEAKIAERWLAVLDHSSLTLKELPLAGRIDQVSASLGYRFIDRGTRQQSTRATAGAGIRSTGNYSGERMQNGLHRIIGSDTQQLPYVDSTSTDVTAWIDMDHYSSFHTSSGNGLFGGWQSAYWLRASSLVTSDSQWDNALGAYAITSRNAIDIWLGVRRDWRSGYDQDFVQHATASAEDDVAIVFGVRMGALVIETVQQINNKASYGQLKLVADGRQSFPPGQTWPRLGIEFGFVVPDVMIQLAVKYKTRLLTNADSNWRESLMIGLEFGEPQYGDNPEIYVPSQQVSIAIEWEKSLAAGSDWIQAYGSAGLGWRRESLVGDGSLNGLESDTVGETTAVAGFGLRFTAATLSENWRYRLQLGLSARAPLSSTNIMFAGESLKLHENGLGVSLGMTFDFN